MENTEKLSDLRKELDDADARLLSAFLDRLKTVDKIAAYKKSAGVPVFDAAREEEILRRVQENAGTRNEADAAALFREILRLSRARQEERLKSGESV